MKCHMGLWHEMHYQLVIFFFCIQKSIFEMPCLYLSELPDSVWYSQHCLYFQASPASLDDLLLPKTIEYVPDIYAIGAQEAMSDRQDFSDFTLHLSIFLLLFNYLVILSLCTFMHGVMLLLSVASRCLVWLFFSLFSPSQKGVGNQTSIHAGSFACSFLLCLSGCLVPLHFLASRSDLVLLR